LAKACPGACRSTQSGSLPTRPKHDRPIPHPSGSSDVAKHPDSRTGFYPPGTICSSCRCHCHPDQGRSRLSLSQSRQSAIMRKLATWPGRSAISQPPRDQGASRCPQSRRSTRSGQARDHGDQAMRRQPSSIHFRSSSLSTGRPATTSAISRRRLPSSPTRGSWPPCTSSIRSPQSRRASAARRARPTSEPANPRAVDRFSVRAGQNLPMELSFSRIRCTMRRRLS
jgi:hypothetical protein